MRRDGPRRRPIGPGGFGPVVGAWPGERTGGRERAPRLGSGKRRFRISGAQLPTDDRPRKEVRAAGPPRQPGGPAGAP